MAMSFWGELKRRNVFKVAIAYLVASWLIVQVVGVLTEPLSLPDVLDTIVVVLLAIGFPFALIIAWIYEVTPEGVRITSTAGGAVAASNTSGKRLTSVVIVLFVVAIGLMAVNRFITTPIPEGFGAGSRLAILPCTDLSPDPSNSFFAPGIHQELVTQLDSLSGLEVISPNSVQQYAGRPTPAGQVAEELQVQAVMECSASYSGNQVRLTTLLVDGESASSLWSSVYPADMSNLDEIFQIQADIAMQVANALRVEFFDDERERIERAPTKSREAYELYLEATALDPVAAYRPIIALMDRALELDAEFAEAWSRKSVAHSTGFVGIPEEERRALMLADAIEAAQRAIELSPNEGHGYAARAQARAVQSNWLGAEQDDRLARERGSSSFDSARLLLATGYLEDARGAMEVALGTNPRDYLILAFLPMVHEMLGDVDLANAAYRRGKSQFPEGPWFGDATTWALVRIGRDQVGPGYDAIGGLAGEFQEVWQLTDDGDIDGALELIRRLASENQAPARLTHLSAWAAYVGDAEYALQLFAAAVSDTGSGQLMAYAWVPVFGELRQLEGFRDLMREIGLVDYWQTRGWPDTCRPLGDDNFVCS
jgi:TolB-like protein